jgi:hypothetical protein
MNKDLEKRIKERAYQLWEAEGRPHGKHEQHWQRASKLIEGDEPAPKAKQRRTTIHSPAAGVKSLAEIPAKKTKSGKNGAAKPAAMATPKKAKSVAPPKPKPERRSKVPKATRNP